MQDYREVLETDTVRGAREIWNNNLMVLMSNFSGTAFPTENLVVGMKCYRTDGRKMYTLTGIDPAVWEEDSPDRLKTPRTISVYGKATGTPAAFDGSADIAVKITAVTADACEGNSRTASLADEVRCNRASAVNAPRHVWFSDDKTETKRNADDNFLYNPVSQTLTVPKLDGQAARAVKDGNGSVIADTYAPKNGAGASGTWPISISGTAAAASSIGNDAANMRFHWSGQDGQPAYLWGGNDQHNMYVWNPSNFRVSYANNAGGASSATTAYNIPVGDNGGNIWIQT